MVESENQARVAALLAETVLAGIRFAYTTKNKNMKSINERPEAGKTVTVYYNFVKDGEKRHGNYRGRWNGNRWEMRKPYTKDEFEPIPSEIELIGWDEL